MEIDVNMCMYVFGVCIRTVLNYNMSVQQFFLEIKRGDIVIVLYIYPCFCSLMWTSMFTYLHVVLSDVQPLVHCTTSDSYNGPDGKKHIGDVFRVDRIIPTTVW
jgi:hypothetical protein